MKRLRFLLVLMAAVLFVFCAYAVAEGTKFEIEARKDGEIVSAMPVMCVDIQGKPLTIPGAKIGTGYVQFGITAKLCAYHNLIDHSGYTFNRAYVLENGKQFAAEDIHYNGKWWYRNTFAGWELVPADENGQLKLYMEFAKITSSLTNNPVHENIHLTLYDYGTFIDVGPDKDLLFGYAKDRKFEGIDGPPPYYSKNYTHYSMPDMQSQYTLNPGRPIIKRKLVNGVPETTSGRSYNYLFRTEGDALYTGMAKEVMGKELTDYSRLREETIFTPGVGYMSPYESMRFDMEGDGGLFYEDEHGYYAYDCSEISAFFNQQTGKFELSPDLIGVGHYGGLPDITNYPNYGVNFFPFTKAGEAGTMVDMPHSAAKRLNVLPFSKTEGLQDGIPNMWFGMSMEFEFYMPEDGKVNGEDMVFTFSGDDDVWCYIDDVLVLDIGGCHGPLYGTINFATGEVNDPNNGGSNSGKHRTLKQTFEEANASTKKFTGDTFTEYTRHTVKFFYMERGGNISFCKLRFNMPQLPAKSLTVSKQLEPHENTDLTDLVKSSFHYEFRVLEADEEGNATNRPLIRQGDRYTVLSGGQAVRTDTVGPGGVFRLRADEAAQFTDMWMRAEKAGVKNYVIEERLPQELSGAYGEVEYAVDGATNTVTGENGVQTSFTTFTTDAISANQTQVVAYRNRVKTSVPVYITKVETGKVPAEGDRIHRIQVLTGNAGDPVNKLMPIAEGSIYRVGDEERTVLEAGVIELKSNETAMFRLMNGTQFMVRELNDPAYTYRTTYTVQETACAPYARGTIAAGQSSPVRIVVVNEYYIPGEIPQTGDASRLGLWLCLTAFSALGITLLKRKQA